MVCKARQDSSDDHCWKHAAVLLGWLDHGSWPDLGGDSIAMARARVETLAVLLDLVPRSGLKHLDAIAAAWLSALPDNVPVSASALKEIALATLAEKANGGRRGRMRAGVTRNDVQPDEALAQAALRAWREQLLQNPEWNYLPAIVPGEAHIPIDQVYVDLFAVEDKEDDFRSGDREPRRLARANEAAVTAFSMVTRTLEQCIVLGNAGSGKSTLVKWLARTIAKSQFPDFDTAIVVRLSTFADQLTKRPQLSIGEFFLGSLGLGDQDWSVAAEWIRRESSSTRRFLLLLDGWDEVPVSQRTLVREKIWREQPHFITVVTSRPSGLPRQLGGTVQTDFYRIAGLGDRTIHKLVGNLLKTIGRPELSESIKRRIDSHADLKEMAGNPFLLGLLVRVLARSVVGDDVPQSLAAMYERLTSWIREQAAHEAGGDPLRGEHLRGLQRLSYERLFQDASAPYLFRWRDLVNCLGHASVEPVLRSRFVNREHPVEDEFAFAHATIQEFFAALHLADFDRPEFVAVVEKAFGTMQQLIVLEFLAGLGQPSAEQLRFLASQWLRRPDRFGHVLLRVAKLAASGKWMSPSDEGLRRSIYDGLWREIETGDEMGIVKAAIEEFARLDVGELGRRVKKAKGLGSWSVNCLMDVMPPAMREQIDWPELMPGAWQFHIGQEARGPVDDQKRQEMRSRITDPMVSEEDRQEAIMFIGAIRDVGSASSIVEILQDPAEPLELRELTIDCLGALGTRDAIDALVDVVTGNIPLPPVQRRTASATLRNTPIGRKALDPSGRDRLLRRLAALLPENPCVPTILAALEGHPIREGAGVIGELVVDRRLSPELRCEALHALATVADRTFIMEIVSRMDQEAPPIAYAMLDIAIERKLPIPFAWLGRRIRVETNRVDSHRLLKRLVQAVSQSTGRDWEAGSSLLHELVLDALGGDETPETEVRAKALTIALPCATGRGRSCIPKRTADLAMQVLERFSQSVHGDAEGRVLLAVAVLEQFGDPRVALDLKRTLDAIFTHADRFDARSQQQFRLALALANAIARLAPQELLEYPLTCEPVQIALRLLSAQRGWLVFDKHIVDSNGETIGSVPPPDAIAIRHAPIELVDVLKELKESQRRAIQSFYAMVGPGGPCDFQTSYATIHSTMLEIAKGESSLSDSLASIFAGKKLPRLDTWRKTLQRIETKFAARPEMTAFLKRIGMCRRGTDD